VGGLSGALGGDWPGKKKRGVGLKIRNRSLVVCRGKQYIQVEKRKVRFRGKTTYATPGVGKAA